MALDYSFTAMQTIVSLHLDFMEIIISMVKVVPNQALFHFERIIYHFTPGVTMITWLLY